MKEIQIRLKNKQALVSSKQVADDFKKKHQHVMRDIRELMRGVQNWTDLFHESTYIHKQNKQEYPMYLMNRDGFTLLAMGFTGNDALQWKLKYIEAFNKMEKTIQKQLPTSSTELFKLALGSIEETNSKIESVNNDLQTFKKDMPLLGIEESKVTVAVRKKGIECLNGKESNAYQDKSLRGKVYADIYRELKRQFDVASYKAIKRNQIEIATQVINDYKAPLVLQEQINIINNQERLCCE